MLEKEHVSVLNEVIVSCLATAGRYETVISVLEDKGLRDKFRDIAETRKQTAIDLEEALRAMGDFPKEPDPEKEALKNLWTRIKASVKKNEYSVLFHEAGNLENEIDARCDNALQHDFPPNIIRILTALRQDSIAFRKWLNSR